MNLRVSNKIYYLYLILSVMIMALHCVYMELFETNNVALEVNQFFNIIYNMAVSTFFFVSAMLFYKNAKSLNYTSVIKKKFFSLIVPYLIWNTICWPLKELKNYLQFGEISTTDAIEIIAGIVLSKWNPVLWFIRVLYIYIIIYPIILYIVKKKVICNILILFSLVINVYIGPTVGYSTMRYWFPIYLIGAYLSYWHYDKVLGDKAKPNYIKIAVSFILFIGLCFFAYFNDYGLYICRMFSPILIWIIADMLLTEKKPFWWVKQTFYYYCTQMIFSIVAQKIYIAVFGNGQISAIIANVIMPIILLVVLVPTAYVLKFIAKPVYNILTGSRN